MNEYVGAIHIHSTYSDGTGKIEDIGPENVEVRESRPLDHRNDEKRDSECGKPDD